MSTEDNQAKSRRFFEDVWNQGNLAVVDELVAATFVDHGLFPPVQGLEALKHYVGMYRTAFPDAHFTIEDIISEGDKVVARFTATGTHQGTLLGIAPTGKQVTVTGINITRYEKGKVVEGWNNFDTLGMLQQLGAVPAPGRASS
jgi:steroid delta-isomerase-like uncharacterized protein